MEIPEYVYYLSNHKELNSKLDEVYNKRMISFIIIVVDDDARQWKLSKKKDYNRYLFLMVKFRDATMISLYMINSRSLSLIITEINNITILRWANIVIDNDIIRMKINKTYGDKLQIYKGSNMEKDMINYISQIKMLNVLSLSIVSHREDNDELLVDIIKNMKNLPKYINISGLSEDHIIKLINLGKINKVTIIESFNKEKFLEAIKNNGKSIKFIDLECYNEHDKIITKFYNMTVSKGLNIKYRFIFDNDIEFKEAGNKFSNYCSQKHPWESFKFKKSIDSDLIFPL